MPCDSEAPATENFHWWAGSVCRAGSTRIAASEARCQSAAMAGAAAASGALAQASAKVRPLALQLCMCNTVGTPPSGTVRSAVSGLHGSSACSGVPSGRSSRQLKVG